MYGFEEIKTDIERVNIDNEVHLLKDVAPDEIKPPTGTVDVRLGVRRIPSRTMQSRSQIIEYY